MVSIKNLIIIFLIFLPYHAFAQDDFNVLGESTIAINHNLSKKYTIGFSMRSRYFLYSDTKFQYKQQQVDVFHFSTFRLNNSHRISVGIYYRNRNFFETGSNELRFMEQFRYSKQSDKVRFRHRIRAEQRFLKNQTILRQRYRFAIDFPIKGETLDVGEPYFMGALEGLISLSKQDAPEIDSRTTALIGWQISKNLKLQTGLEYRLEAFNINASNHLFVLSSAVLRL